MKQYGYLSQGAPNTEALHTEEAITEAVRQIQVYGGLQPSGVIDEETIQVRYEAGSLTLPQCIYLAALQATVREQGQGHDQK